MVRGALCSRAALGRSALPRQARFLPCLCLHVCFGARRRSTLEGGGFGLRARNRDWRGASRQPGVFGSDPDQRIPTPEHDVLVAGFPCQDLSFLNQDRPKHSMGIAQGSLIGPSISNHPLHPPRHRPRPSPVPPPRLPPPLVILVLLLLMMLILLCPHNHISLSFSRGRGRSILAQNGCPPPRGQRAWPRQGRRSPPPEQCS